MGQKLRIDPDDVDLQGLRVLIVEDQPFVSLAVADMIVDMGGIVSDVAATLDEALAAAARGDFALALLDVDLQGQPSNPVADALQRAGKPFVVTSGYDADDFPGFGRAPRLVKPYLPGQLRATLLAFAAPPAPETRPN